MASGNTKNSGKQPQEQQQVLSLAITHRYGIYFFVLFDQNVTSATGEEDFAQDNYGNLPLIQSKDKLERQLVPVRDINESLAKQTIWLRGRVQTSRGKGKQCFLVIRHQSATIQAVVCVNENISKQMVKFVAK